MVSGLRPADEETCRASIAAEHSYLERAKPDIVVIAALWNRYREPERISETLRFLQKIGVPRIVEIGIGSGVVGTIAVHFVQGL